MSLLKIIASLGVLMIGISVSFFFIFFLPNYIKNKELNRRIVECRNMAEQRYKDTKKEHIEGDESNYQSHYNQKLNQCIYYEENYNMGAPEKSRFSFLFDLYSNTQLDSCFPGDSTKPFGLNEMARMEKHRSALFEEKSQ